MTEYIGRFAPSPSGPLHFGSLVCALASYLDARKNHGKWLVRIEDIDPPREVSGASKDILNTLAAHHLHWDDTPIYQSQRSHFYEIRLEDLQRAGLAYPCSCVRKRLSGLNGAYDKHCLKHPPNPNIPSALRLNVDRTLDALQYDDVFTIDDILQGKISQNLRKEGDFIIHRKDGLFAYQLAVVNDDIAQGVTHVVRGCDLLETSLQQKLLHYIFNSQPPSHMHTPVITDDQGRKLSKQNHAEAIDNNNATGNLILALKALGFDGAERHATPETLIPWAVGLWPPTTLSRSREINYAQLIKS